jgi:nitrogen fixation protein NifB
LAGHHPLTGELGAAFLVRRQLAGIRRAVAAGLTVKVNTVLIPGVNFEGAGPGALETGAPESGALETGAPRPGQSEIGLVARAVARAGASLHNIVPLIPLGAMANRPRPSCDELRRARREAAGFLPQFRLCRQCRADAVGVPGQEVGPADEHGSRH